VTMEQRRLGTTGVWVSELCLGTMMFGEWGTKDHDESIRIIHRALDAGIMFVDTADVYSAGESEIIVGEALMGRRDDIVLATKAFMPMSDDLNHRGSSRRWIIREVEDSLRRLDTDWIDLYQIHRWDPETNLDETLGALSDLVHQGKIRYFGHSTFPASAIVEAQWTAQRRNRERFVTEQPTYSILTRGIENDVLPTCQRYGMGVLSYSPLAGGWLSGRYRRDATEGPASVARQRLANRFDLDLPDNQRKLEAADQLAQLADDAGIGRPRQTPRVRPSRAARHGRLAAAHLRDESTRRPDTRHRRPTPARQPHRSGNLRPGPAYAPTSTPTNPYLPGPPQSSGNSSAEQRWPGSGRNVLV
jgi:aryl-alcohol dehydrogenase-like predicted oxidoreductase